MSVLLRILAGTLPEGISFPTWQLMNNHLCDINRVEWPDGYTVFNYGSTAPAPENRIYPWLRIDPGTGIFDRLYTYYAGFWCSPHPIPPNSKMSFPWKGTLNAGDLGIYDGGDGGISITAYTGPMWEEDPDFRGVFMVGCGTLPSTTVLNVGDTGGEEAHTLTIDELPKMTFEAGHILRNVDPLGDTTLVGPAGTVHTSVPKPYDYGANLAHNNMPPYRAVYFIRRTARVFYTI